MTAKNSIGEVSISVWGRDYIFRPLFCRIESLGSPTEIIELFNQVQQPNDDGFIAAWRFLCAFSDEEETDNLLGYFFYCEKCRGLVYVRGKMKPEHIHIIGSSMAADALIGRPTPFEKASSKSGQAESEFNVSDYIAIGDAHFGGIDWWNKTMVELQKAIRAKNGPSKEEQAWMSADELDSLYAKIGKKEVLAK